MKILLTIVSLFFCNISFSQSKLSRRQLYDSSVQEHYRLQYAFMRLSDTGKIVDIGTGAGYNLSRISSYYPTLHFIAEDIDTVYCNRGLFIKTANKIGERPNINNIEFHIGTETSTNLPSSSFNTILAFDVIHEMTYKTEMLADLKRILRKGGTIIIGEILVYKKRKKEKDCNYPFLTEAEFKEIIAASGLQIVREQTINNSLKFKYSKLFECKFAD